MAYESLLLFAGTAFSAMERSQSYAADVNQANAANTQALRQREAAAVQAGINNQLAVNNYLYINREDALDLEKLSVDKDLLRKKIRRNLASFAAQSVGRGLISGSPKDAGGSFGAAAANIERYGLQALLAKDVNREKRVLDFAQRTVNTGLQTQSANNKLFSELSAGVAVPDRTGLMTGIGSDVIKGLTIANSGTT